MEQPVVVVAALLRLEADLLIRLVDEDERLVVEGDRRGRLHRVGILRVPGRHVKAPGSAPGSAAATSFPDLLASDSARCPGLRPAASPGDSRPWPRRAASRGRPCAAAALAAPSTYW